MIDPVSLSRSALAVAWPHEFLAEAPVDERTAIVVTPATPGTYEFTCGMSMLHGRLIAE